MEEISSNINEITNNVNQSKKQIMGVEKIVEKNNLILNKNKIAWPNVQPASSRSNQAYRFSQSAGFCGAAVPAA